MPIEKFVKSYNIKTYECDRGSKLRVPALFNILQDAADGSAGKLGFGMEFCLEHGRSWVGVNYHIKINRLPKIHETITITTWPSDQKTLFALRDFSVTDEKGEEIIAASSQWILIDFAKRRPLNLFDNLPERMYLEERALQTDFPKIPEPVEPVLQKTFAVRFDDIDINNHVNNSIYPLWASESVDNDFRLEHEPSEIEISFKKECHYGENVEVLTNESNGTSISFIKSATDGRELARVRINWRQA